MKLQTKTNYMQSIEQNNDIFLRYFKLQEFNYYSAIHHRMFI